MVKVHHIPSVDDVFSELFDIRLWMREEDIETTDIRLCVDPDGWIIRTGEVAYDEWHSPVCSSSSVSRTDGKAQLSVVAQELIDDALDQTDED